MKTTSIYLSLLLMIFCHYSFAQNVNIPDINFKAALVKNSLINTNNDQEISIEEAKIFTGLIHVSSEDISDLTGIEAFVNLTSLQCDQNAITHLDLHKNTKL